jgi:hypothetical protein
MVRPRK